MSEAADEKAPIFDMKAAAAKFGAAVDNTRRARKVRHSVVSSATDRRSLRATGRTDQFNFKSVPGLKKRAQEAATAEGITLAEWMERAVTAALEAAEGD